MSELVHLLNQPEGRTLEFKRDLSSLRPILKTLVAFANTSGGTLVIGREDDGRLCGIADAQANEERLTNAIADSIEPALLPDVDLVTAFGVDLLVVRVAYWPGPFYLKKLGPEEGVLVRLGSTNRRADAKTLAELRATSSRLVFDQLPCTGTTLDDLDLDAARKAFAAVGRELDDAKLQSLGLVCLYGAELVPSNGGMILFGRPIARSRFFPDAQVRCARFLGPDKVEFLDRLDIEGTMLDALRAVPSFIRRNTRMAGRITGDSLGRHDTPEYPAVAVREVLTNAVAHTDYALHGMDIQVAIYSDRLEIQNPGPLPFPLTVADLKAGVSRIRNPVIAHVLRELDLMEKWGSGYKRITDACDEDGYHYPEWVELGSAVRVVFWPHPGIVDSEVREAVREFGEYRGGYRGEYVSERVGEYVGANVGVNVGLNVGLNAGANDPLNERQRWFLSRLHSGKRVKAIDLAVHFDVAKRTAERDIADLTARYLVEFVGSPKVGRYRLTGRVPALASRLFNPTHVGVNVGTNVGTNVGLDVGVNFPAVNERQAWLLDRLGSGESLKAKDLAAHFGTTRRTAERDIAELTARGLVEFVGPPKTGTYRLRSSRRA